MSSLIQRLRPTLLAVRPSVYHGGVGICTRVLASRGYSTWRDEINAKWKDDEEIAEARKWLESFTEQSIPRKNCDVQYSHSSGPGGQNVNKLSTKATLHLDLNHKADFLPSVIVRKVKENCRHLTRDDMIVIQADDSRKQSENTEHAFHRLYTIIRGAVSQDLPGETSPEQHKKVLKLQKEERQKRRVLKDKQKSKKGSRRSSGSDL